LARLLHHGDRHGRAWLRTLHCRQGTRCSFFTASCRTRKQLTLHPQRYIAPLIAPPTPAALTADKAAIDASFTRAFDLLDTLAADTAVLKDAEAARTSRLDAALADAETALADLKAASRRRDDDARRVADEVHALHALVPKAVKAHEDATDARLKELAAEMRSLKTLVANRMAAPASAPVPSPSPITSARAATATGAPTTASAPASGATAGDGVAEGEKQSTATPSAPSATAPSSSTPYGSYGRPGGPRGGIPAWQLAAAKKSESQAAQAATVQEESTAGSSSTEGGA